MTETAFIEQLKIGDPSACKLLVERYGSRVFNTALGLLQQRNDAEDVAQEVFAYAFLSIEKFRGDSTLSTWLYRITVNKSLDSLKARRRIKRRGFFQQLFANEGAQLAVDVPHFQHPGVLMENQERAKILFLAIEKLPAKQKTAFVLHKLEERSYTEIAEILETSLASVESLMFRAKQNLRQSLSHWFDRQNL